MVEVCCGFGRRKRESEMKCKHGSWETYEKIPVGFWQPAVMELHTAVGPNVAEKLRKLPLS